MLTAQHCVKTEAGEWMNLSSVTWEYFGLGDSISPMEISVPVAQVFTSDDSYQNTRAADWAFIRLSNPISDGMGYLGMVSPERLSGLSAEHVTVAGYAADLDTGALITMDWGCKIASLGSGVLQHHCKTWHGDSGSPIIVSDGPLKGGIVAVHAYGTYNGEKSLGLGGGPTTAQFYATWKKLRAEEEGK